MPICAWFPTFICGEPLQKSGLDRLNRELAAPPAAAGASTPPSTS